MGKDAVVCMVIKFEKLKKDNTDEISSTLNHFLSTTFKQLKIFNCDKIQNLYSDSYSKNCFM